MPRSSQKSTSTPDLITYRYDERMAYVKPAETHDKAAEYAREVFSDLSATPTSRISFSITVRVQDKINKVTIAPRAWRDTMSSLAKFEIVDIVITSPSPRISIHELAPPEYSRTPEKQLDAPADEKNYLCSSCPASSRSRSPSPSSRRSCSPMEWTRNLLQRNPN